MVSNPVLGVTGYWQIAHRKHNTTEYDTWFNRTLKINVPYLVYYEDDHIKEKFTRIRNSVASPTIFVKRLFNEFEVNRRHFYHPEVFKRISNHTRLRDETQKTKYVPSIEVGLIWLEKVFLMLEAAQKNPFNSTWVAWLDAGLCRYRYEDLPSNSWPHPDVLSQLPTDKVIYSGTSCWGFHDFAATAFLYSVNMASVIAELFSLEFMACASKTPSWRCYSEQVIFTRLIRKYPELFYRIDDGYGVVVTNLYSPSLYSKQLQKQGQYSMILSHSLEYHHNESQFLLTLLSITLFIACCCIFKGFVATLSECWTKASSACHTTPRWWVNLRMHPILSKQKVDEGPSHSITD